MSGDSNTDILFSEERQCVTLPYQTKLMFDHPVEFPNFPISLVNGVHGYNISLSVQVTGKGSAMSTKDGEEIERTARLETAIGERQPIQITNCKNSIIGELYFTSPPNWSKTFFQKYCHVIISINVFYHTHEFLWGWLKIGLDFKHIDVSPCPGTFLQHLSQTRDGTEDSTLIAFFAWLQCYVWLFLRAKKWSCIYLL